MNWLANILNSVAIFIEREAGHNVTSMVVIILGMYCLDMPTRQQAARDLVMFGLGVLSRSMGQSNARKEPIDGNVNAPTPD